MFKPRVGQQDKVGQQAYLLVNKTKIETSLLRLHWVREPKANNDQIRILQDIIHSGNITGDRRSGMGWGGVGWLEQEDCRI